MIHHVPLFVEALRYISAKRSNHLFPLGNKEIRGQQAHDDANDDRRDIFGKVADCRYRRTAHMIHCAA